MVVLILLVGISLTVMYLIKVNSKPKVEEGFTTVSDLEDDSQLAMEKAKNKEYKNLVIKDIRPIVPDTDYVCDVNVIYKGDNNPLTKENIEEKIEWMKDFFGEDIDLNDIRIDSIKELEILEPYGEGNKKINIIYKNLKIISIRALSEGKHIKLNLQDDNINLDAIGFNMGEYSKCYQIGDRVDVVGNIEINKFNNTEKVQISLKDMRKAVED